MNTVYPFISHLKSEWYKSTQYHILNHNLHDSEILSFSEKELLQAEWKEEREFTLNGYSYDLIRIDFKKGRKYYRCYFDRKEMVINSILNFSGFFVTKKGYAWQHFNVPVPYKKGVKTFGSFIFLNTGLMDGAGSYSQPESGYAKRMGNACDLSVTIPPPEESIAIDNF